MPKQPGITRASRIRMDYYQQPDGLRRLRWLLVLLALLATGVYAALAYLGLSSEDTAASGSAISEWWATQASTGPVARVHAAFENECAKCHVDDFRVPLANDAWRGAHAKQIIDTVASSCSTSECHQVSHHFSSNATPAALLQEKNCVLCHREHLGRDHDIADVADTSCASCHANLNAVCPSTPRLADRDVANFSQDHAEFRSLKSDLGQIKFDHYQHMQPGQVEPGPKGAQHRGGFQLIRLPEKWKASYRASLEKPELVQLECGDCHSFQTTSSDVASLVADGSLSQYAMPIRFQQHCEACHELSIEGLPLPHAATDRELKPLIRSKIEGGRLAGELRMPSDVVRKIPRPGAGAGSKGSDYSVGDDQIDAKLDELAHRCGQCHDPKHLTEEHKQDAAAGRTSALIPERWLLSGSFSHAAHARMDCLFCHEQTMEQGASSDPQDHDEVMISNIESCKWCHRPAEAPTPSELVSGELHERLGMANQVTAAGEQLPAQPTWASDRCVYCHKYHWSRPPAVPPPSVIPPSSVDSQTNIPSPLPLGEVAVSAAGEGAPFFGSDSAIIPSNLPLGIGIYTSFESKPRVIHLSRLRERSGSKARERVTHDWPYLLRSRSLHDGPLPAATASDLPPLRGGGDLCRDQCPLRQGASFFGSDSP